MGYKKQMDVIKESRKRAESFVQESRKSFKESTEVDQDAARELKLFIDNDEQLYNSQMVSIQKNLAAKKARGNYDHELSKKLWLYLVDAGAKKYAKEFGGKEAWHEVFPKATRMKVAEEFADEFQVNWEDGEYDDYIPKKYQTKKEGILRESAEEARSLVGSGQLPNKYYVSAHGNFFVSRDQGDHSGLVWASEDKEMASKVEIEPNEYGTKVFDTFEEALEEAEELAEGISEDEDDLRSVTIEDHLSGTIYEIILCAYPTKFGYNFEVETFDDTSFTKETLEKKGVKFESRRRSAKESSAGDSKYVGIVSTTPKYSEPRNSSLMKDKDGIAVVGNLPHYSVFKPKTEEDRQRLIQWLQESPVGGKAYEESSRKTPDNHQKKVLIDTVRNPLKGKFLGGPSAEEAEEVLRTKFKYTDKQIAKLKESRLSRRRSLKESKKRRVSVGRVSDGEGFDINFDPIETYKGKEIGTQDGDIVVYDPVEQTVFVVGLDDSKSSGRRKFNAEYDTVESAREYIDWITRDKANESRRPLREAKEYILWGLPDGSDDPIDQKILLSNGASMADVEKVKEVAAKDGWHSFKVQTLDLEEPWDAQKAFAKTINPVSKWRKTPESRRRSPTKEGSSLYTVEKEPKILRRGNRLQVKGFKTSDAMYKFLATGSNALEWKESNKGLKPGTYAYAGGKWHNVKDLDPSVLSHI